MPPVSFNDAELIQITASTLARAAQNSGAWIACRPGCSECCLGAFPINALDDERLRSGLQSLETEDSARAKRVVQRAREYVERQRVEFPGDAVTGVLGEDDRSQERFEGFANDEPCPALDPLTHTCDLYEARPMTCRLFGPALRNPDGEATTCELCYQGATDEQIASCAVDTEEAESAEALALETLEERVGARGMTIVAWCLAAPFR
jgi:Fe-S-cluster containining protein